MAVPGELVLLTRPNEKKKKKKSVPSSQLPFEKTRPSFGGSHRSCTKIFLAFERETPNAVTRHPRNLSTMWENCTRLDNEILQIFGHWCFSMLFFIVVKVCHHVIWNCYINCYIIVIKLLYKRYANIFYSYFMYRLGQLNWIIDVSSLFST